MRQVVLTVIDVTAEGIRSSRPSGLVTICGNWFTLHVGDRGLVA